MVNIYNMILNKPNEEVVASSTPETLPKPERKEKEKPQPHIPNPFVIPKPIVTPGVKPSPKA